MIRLLLLVCCLASVAAQETPGVVLMGYARIGADGQPQGVTVALSRERFAALVAAAKAPTPDADAPVLAIGPGTWRGVWRDGRWNLTGTVPLAAPSAAWGEVRLPMPGTVSAVQVQSLAGAPVPSAPAWRMDGDVLILALPPRSQTQVQITATRESVGSAAVAMTFPPGGTLTIETPGTLVASLGGVPIIAPLSLPTQPCPLQLTVDRPVTTADSGSLGLTQAVTLRHLGDHIAWTAQISIDSQRQPPGVVELILPPRLDVLTVEGDGLAGWRQREGRLELRWSAGARERARSANLSGVIIADGSAVPALALPGAVRGGGTVAVVDAGPVRWSIPEGLAGVRRVQPGEGQRFRLAWDGEPPAGLALPFTSAAALLTATSDGLLVTGPGRWRAELVFTLGGTGLADHLRIAVPPPWRVVAADGAAWLPDPAGGGILRATAALAAGAQVVLRCEAPDGADGLPRIALAGDGVGAARVRWLLADRGTMRATLSGPATDAEALAADLARANIRPRADERLRNAIELRVGSTAQLALGASERRQRMEAAHYLIAGASSLRWSCRVHVRPEQGALDRVRIRLPEGARLADRRGEAVAEWSEADGWLTARFAAPLDRPAALDLSFTVDWSEAAGRERVALGAFACEPALDRETVALAEDEEAGQLVRRPDGLEERPANAVPLPAGVASALLAGRTWAATGAAWKLALERERLDQGLGADAVATLVDVHSAIDPDRRLMSRATWYVINRSRSALELVLPEGCALWEVRLGGQPVRARQGTAPDRVSVPVNPLRPGEAATRIQVCWAQAAGDGLRPKLPVFPELRVMRALWRFTAPPGTSLGHVDGWEPVPAGDATGARVEVLADELKRLRSSSEESPAVRARLADQLQLIDQELTDHVAVLERLGQDASRWTGDVAVRQADVQAQNEYQQRNLSFNSLGNDNRQAVREKLNKLSSVAKSQRDRRGGLLLDRQVVRWPALPADAAAGPDWAARLIPQAAAGTPEQLSVGAGLGAGSGTAASATTAALTGIDLLPAQESGEELTLRADNLGAQPVLRLESRGSDVAWGVWLLLGCAALALGVAISRRRAA